MSIDSVHQDSNNGNTELSVESLKEIGYTNILLKVASGMSITKALQGTEIKKTNFFRWAKNHPQIITEIVESRRAEKRALYTDIADTEIRLIEAYLRRIEAQLDGEDSMKLDELENTINQVGSMRAKLEDSLGMAQEERQDPAVGYLAGLKVKKVIRVTETLSFEEESSEKVLDGEVSEQRKNYQYATKHCTFRLCVFHLADEKYTQHTRQYCFSRNTPALQVSALYYNSSTLL